MKQVMEKAEKRVYIRYMSLTKDDLKSIKEIVEDANENLRIDVAAGFAKVDDKFTKVHKKIDVLDDRLSQKIDALDERLSQKIDQVDDKLDVKYLKLENNVQRVDRHDIAIKQLQTKTS